ncbi:hypothetical protein RvY_05923 [Ramazzottius varieornatus]|uniref:Uncharacterized protein n=1 Tax=Ramazzottius varieornatus TaxID=947166 RepID=A0A1D1UZR4_RAMVA|nr:hypothetical protein RvY_05923 [Ramazzottius varieornatus]
MKDYCASDGSRLSFDVLYNFMIYLTWIMPVYSQTSGLPHIREKRQYGLNDAPAIFIGGPQNRQLGIQSFSPNFQDSFSPLNRPSPSFQPYGPSVRPDYSPPNLQGPFGYQANNEYYRNFQLPLRTFSYDPNGSWMPGQEPPTPSPRLERPFPPPESYGQPVQLQAPPYDPYSSWNLQRDTPSLSGRSYGPPGPQPGYGFPHRRPIDLTIPSYAYVPNKITGEGMQYIPNPPIFAAHGVEYYVSNWTDHINNNLYQSLNGEPVISGPDESFTDSPDEVVTEASAAKGGNKTHAAPGPKRNSISSKSSKVCTSRGSFGVCVNNGRVAEDCVGKSIAKSLICGRDQICCLERTSPDRNSSSSTSGKDFSFRQRPGDGRIKSCVSTDRGVIEIGFCVDNELTDITCKDKFISRSGCEGEQSCCAGEEAVESTTTQIGTPFSRTPFSVISLARQGFSTCLPSGTTENLQMGFCVSTAQIGQFCVDQTVSLSDNCDWKEVCCVDNSRSLDVDAPDNLSEPSVSEEEASASRPVAIRKSPTSALRLRGRPDTSEVCFAPQSHIVGLCIADDEISERCTGKSAFKTGACLSDKSCCVLDNKPKSVRRKPLRTLNRFRSIRRRVPVLTTTPTTTTTIITTTSSTPIPEIVRPCVSQDDPTTIGFCVDQLQVLTLCTSHQVSPSRNCFSEQFCCTTSQQQQTQIVEPTPTLSPVRQQESLPSSAVSFRNGFAQCRSARDFSQLGLCVDEMLVGRFCRDQFVLKSPDCAERQACCVDPQGESGGVILRPAFPTTTTTPTTTTEDQSFVPASSFNARPCSTPRQFSQYGFCVDDSKVSLFCTNQYISKSFDCAETQTCCIDGSGGFVDYQPRLLLLRRRLLRTTTTTPRTIATRRIRKIKVLVPSVVVSPQIFLQCIPLVNNFPLGVCVDEVQIEQLCSGRMVAPSRGCGIGQSCCSYLPELPVAQPPTTTTPVYITTASPAALAVTDNADPLDYEDVHKEIPWRSLRFLTTTSVPSVLQTCTSASSGVLGVCINEMIAMSDCVGKMIEISSQCNPTQLCCSNF